MFPSTASLSTSVLDQNECKKIIERLLKTSETNATNCWLKSKQDRMPIDPIVTPQVGASSSGPGSGKTIAWIAMRAEGKISPSPEFQISRLCRNENCFKASHWVWESPRDKVGRKGCAGLVLVERDNETQFITACEHNPKCKRLTHGTVVAPGTV